MIPVLVCVPVIVQARMCVCMDAASSMHLSGGFEDGSLHACVCVYVIEHM